MIFYRLLFLHIEKYFFLIHYEGPPSFPISSSGKFASCLVQKYKYVVSWVLHSIKVTPPILKDTYFEWPDTMRNFEL